MGEQELMAESLYGDEFELEPATTSQTLWVRGRYPQLGWRLDELREVGCDDFTVRCGEIDPPPRPGWRAWLKDKRRGTEWFRLFLRVPGTNKHLSYGELTVDEAVLVLMAYRQGWRRGKESATSTPPAQEVPSEESSPYRVIVLNRDEDNADFADELKNSTFEEGFLPIDFHIKEVTRDITQWKPLEFNWRMCHKDDDDYAGANRFRKHVQLFVDKSEGLDVLIYKVSKTDPTEVAFVWHLENVHPTGYTVYEKDGQRNTEMNLSAEIYCDSEAFETAQKLHAECLTKKE